MDVYVQPTLQKKVTDDIGFNGTESTSLSDIADSIIILEKDVDNLALTTFSSHLWLTEIMNIYRKT